MPASFAIRLLRSRWAWVVVVTVVFASVAAALAIWLAPTPYQRGMRQASIDQSRGHYEVQVYGARPFRPKS